jgi:hypothetical protein
MPTLCLSAHPAHLIRRGTQDVPIMEGCGRETARDETQVTGLAEVTAAIAAFGARVRGAAPGTSFRVSITLQADGRKPRGFNAAYLDGSLGHLAFLYRRDAAVAVPSIPAAQGRTA